MAATAAVPAIAATRPTVPQMRQYAHGAHEPHFAGQLANADTAGKNFGASIVVVLSFIKKTETFQSSDNHRILIEAD